MTPFPLIRTMDRGGLIFVGLLAAIAVVVPLLNLALPPTSPFSV